MEEKRIATIYDLKRMCSTIKGCESCPLDAGNPYCPDFKNIDKANETVLKWCEEHPQKTYKDDFLEKFPNATVGSDNHAGACRKWIYGKEEVCRGFCTDCWNEVYSNASE